MALIYASADISMNPQMKTDWERQSASIPALTGTEITVLLKLRLMDLSSNVSQYQSHRYDLLLNPDVDNLWRINKYESRAMTQLLGYIENLQTFRLMMRNADSISSRLLNLTDELNTLAEKLGFDDTLSFGPVVLDTTDFVHVNAAKLRSLKLPALR